MPEFLWYFVVHFPAQQTLPILNTNCGFGEINLTEKNNAKSRKINVCDGFLVHLFIKLTVRMLKSYNLGTPLYVRVDL